MTYLFHVWHFPLGTKYHCILHAVIVLCFVHTVHNGNTTFQNDITRRSFNFNAWAELILRILAEAATEQLPV